MAQGENMRDSTNSKELNEKLKMKIWGRKINSSVYLDLGPFLNLFYCNKNEHLAD